LQHQGKPPAQKSAFGCVLFSVSCSSFSRQSISICLSPSSTRNCKQTSLPRFNAQRDLHPRTRRSPSSMSITTTKGDVVKGQPIPSAIFPFPALSCPDDRIGSPLKLTCAMTLSARAHSHVESTTACQSQWSSNQRTNHTVTSRPFMVV